MKKALVVGIDAYPNGNDLHGCVNDATQVASVVERNGDGGPNFDVRPLLSSFDAVGAERMYAAVVDLFSGPADTVLLYFAGHGILNDETNTGYLITQDGKNPNWGVSLAEVLELANRAYPTIKSTVIILDTCHAGYAGEAPGLTTQGAVSFIGNGVTILTACHRRGTAAELDGHGAFTSILLDGLSGAAADIMGRITPASLYAHVDQTLGAWEQRPVYKANVQSFITLRHVQPKVPLEVLRRLPAYFPAPSHEFGLDPTFERNRGEETSRLADIPVNQDNVRVYGELQACNRHGLVVPVDHEHMWDAAVNSGAVRLTASGLHCKHPERTAGHEARPATRRVRRRGVR